MVLKARWWIVVAAVGAAIALWAIRRTADDGDGGGATAETPADTDADTRTASASTAERTAMLPRAPLPPRPVPSGAKTPDAATANPALGAEVVGPHPDDPHEPGMRPHPMTEAHRRLYAENALIQRLNDAMAAHDATAMRALVAEYRQLDPTDQDASQAGYSIIADCIDRPAPASLAAAHQFYDTARHSPLRRPMRRICFENSN